MSSYSDGSAAPAVRGAASPLLTRGVGTRLASIVPLAKTLGHLTNELHAALSPTSAIVAYPLLMKETAKNVF